VTWRGRGERLVGVTVLDMKPTMLNSLGRCLANKAFRGNPTHKA
jgi:hypothetical protein